MFANIAELNMQTVNFIEMVRRVTLRAAAGWTKLITWNIFNYVCDYFICLFVVHKSSTNVHFFHIMELW